MDGFKKTSRFLNGAKIPSLTRRLPFAGLEAIKLPGLVVKVPAAGCKVFLVGGNSSKPSDWHREALKKFATHTTTTDKLGARLAAHLTRILSPEEQRQSGSNAATVVTVMEAVADESRRMVFFRCKANELDVDEHGLVAVLEKSRWRLDDGCFVSRYINDLLLSECPDDEDLENKAEPEPVSLAGRWTLDKDATAELLKKQGDSEPFIQMSLKNLKGIEWVVTESRLINRNAAAGLATDYRLISIKTIGERCEITVEVPGLTEPEIWKVRIKGDRLFGCGCVMRKDASP